MKKYISILVFILVSGIFTSCNDFLTLIPESNYSVEGAYKTQMDFEQAIAGVYAEQQNLYSTNNCWFRAMIGRSDDTRNGSTYLYGLDQFTDSDNVSILTSSWESFWKIINRSNLILEKIDDVEFADASLKNSIKGEAYMLRAWAYWSLGWQYGGMPLVENSLTVNEVKTVPRSTQQETFDFAAEDYKKAIELLPSTWDAANLGRVTKYAAAGMLGRLYMFQSQFSKAKPYLKDVIDSGLYKMENDYRDCFTDAKDNGPERVWEVQFTGGQLGEGQAFSTGTLPEGYTEGILMPFNGYSTAMRISVNATEMYEPGDLRKDLSIVTGLRLNGQIDDISWYFIKYIHYDSYVPKAQSDWATNLPILRYTDVKMMYAEALNEEGYVADGEAFTILNEVRSRAGLPALTSSAVPNQESFRKAIMQERRVEFAFEGLRWRDLVRWGIAKEVMNQHFMHEDEGEGRYRMEDHQTIFAIPFDEISRYNDTSIMWQNPGY